MSIYFGKTARLKSYSAAVKGAKSIIKIEIEVSDSYELASILNDLGETTRAQKAADRKKPLAIEDMRDRT
jgi:hypothetical protein